MDNLLTYRRLKIIIDLDTQINLQEEIVNVLKVSGQTGMIDLKISSLLIKKIRMLKESLIPDDDPQRALRMKKRARKMEIGMARIVSKVVKSQLNKQLINYEGKKNKVIIFQPLSKDK